MPEGHTIHRLARQHVSTFAGHRVAASSPQGRFAAGASRLDAAVMTGAQAHGKHLFLGFAEPDPRGGPVEGHSSGRPAGRSSGSSSGHSAADRWLHVHLGLYGKWVFGQGEPPEPRGAVRVRLVAPDAADGEGAWADLRGPTACEVVTPEEVALVRARLGPDPLRRDADPAVAGSRVRRSRTALGALLMQQEVVAGVGNVYRAEALYRARLDPWMPGRGLDEERWDALWADLVLLLRDGVKRGRIVTTLPADRERRSGAVRREDAHYVYKRTGLPCRICGTPVVSEPMVGRTLYRCPFCQRPTA